MHKESIVLFCDCSSSEHQLIFHSEDEDKEVFISVHLTGFSFWKRLKAGLRYILGYKCRYGHFEEVITSKERLREIINKL